MSNWIWLTPKPEPAERRGGKVTSWRNEPILVNLDHVAILQPVKFRDPDDDDAYIHGSRVIWHGSMPRTEWTVREPPEQIVGRQG